MPSGKDPRSTSPRRRLPAALRNGLRSLALDVPPSSGNVFLLDRLKLRDDKIDRSIALPAYVQDVAKVQFWCAFVEVVLGEASFARPIALRTAR